MKAKSLTLTLILLTLTACTRSLAEPTPDVPPATVTPTLFIGSPVPTSETSIPNQATAPPSFVTFTPPSSGTSNRYAVINVLPDDMLNIRSDPGVENPVVGTLQSSQSGLTRVGKTATVGEDTWFEIQNPGGGTGWVNADFLTEYVPPADFCADTRIPMLLENLETAVHAENGELLQSLVSPAHGLDVIYIRNGTLANYSPEEASWVFQSTYEVDWGPGAGSGEPVIGAFPEIVLPALQDVFKNETQVCNEIKLGGATYPVEWPSVYANINFYSLHNPGNDPSYDGMDWRTWLVGVEYVDGQPYLFALLNYQWEP